jgi:hypothetical protein
MVRRDPMGYYLLSTYQPDGPAPSDVPMDNLSRAVDELVDEMRAARVWVFNGHLESPRVAKVVQASGDSGEKAGPYIGGAEHVGGVCVLETPNRDDAIEWGRRMSEATTLPVEVRPFQ